LIRPPNENLNSPQSYMKPGAYPYQQATPNMSSTPPVYQQQFFPRKIFFSSFK
jgi:hypothetical protein